MQSDETERSALEDETTGQPSDPMDPEGQSEDNQTQEDIEQVKKSRAYFQNKYQETLQRLDQINESGNQWSQGEQTANPNDFTKREREVAEDEGFDLYTIEGQRAFINSIAEANDKVLSKRLQAIREESRREAQFNAESQQAEQALYAWAQANEVPNQLLQEMAQEVVKDFPNARPATAVKYIINNIRLRAKDDTKKQATETAKETAKAKAEQLKSVQQPKEGTAIKPDTKLSVADRLKERAKKQQEKSMQGKW